MLKTKTATVAVLLCCSASAWAQAEPPAPAPSPTAASPAEAEARALVEALEAKYARIEAQRKEQAQKPTTPEAKATAAKTDSTAAGLEMMALALVLGGALGAATWWLRKRQRIQAQDPTSTNLAVSDALWVGKGQRLVLVDVAGRRVLLGITGAGMQSLAVLDPGIGATPERVAPAKFKATPMPDGEEWFSEMVKDEMIRDRPTRDDRRRILSQLNSL